MDIVTFADEFEVEEMITDLETPISEPGEILYDETDVDIMQDLGEIGYNDIYEIVPEIITYNEDNNLVNSDMFSADPVDIEEISQINYDLQEEENEKFDETNILVSLGSIRDAVKSGTAESIESDADILLYLKSIESQERYTNYLLAMLIGILVIKTVFEKILP